MTRDILPTKLCDLPSNDSHLTESVTGHIVIVEYNLACEPNAGHTQVLVDLCTKDALLWWSGQQPRHECKLKATGDSACPRQQHKNPHVKFLASGILIIFAPEQHQRYGTAQQAASSGIKTKQILGRKAIGYRACNPTRR